MYSKDETFFRGLRKADGWQLLYGREGKKILTMSPSLISLSLLD